MQTEGEICILTKPWNIQAIQLDSLVDQKLQQAMGTMEIKQGAGSNIGEHIDKMTRVSEAVKCCAAQLLFAHWKEA